MAMAYIVEWMATANPADRFRLSPKIIYSWTDGHITLPWFANGLNRCIA
jgi:hypothetical protein